MMGVVVVEDFVVVFVIECIGEVFGIVVVNVVVMLYFEIVVFCGGMLVFGEFVLVFVWCIV